MRGEIAFPVPVLVRAAQMSYMLKHANDLAAVVRLAAGFALPLDEYSDFLSNVDSGIVRQVDDLSGADEVGLDVHVVPEGAIPSSLQCSVRCSLDQPFQRGPQSTEDHFGLYEHGGRAVHNPGHRC